MPKILAILLLVLPTSSQAQDVLIPAEQETKSSIEPFVRDEAPKRWGMLIDIWAEGNMNGINRGDRAGVKQDNARLNENINDQWYDILLLRPSYLVTDRVSVAVGQEIIHSFGGIDERQQGIFEFQDTYAQVSHSRLYRDQSIQLSGYFRPYFPTSERSQDPVMGRHLMLRAALTLSTSLSSNFSLGYTVEPRYFFTKNKFYIGENGTDRMIQEKYRIRHWLGLNAEIGRFIGYQNLGLTSRYFYEDFDSAAGRNIAGPQRDNLYWETALGTKISDNFSVLGGLYTETTHNIRRSDFVLINDKEFLYFLEGTMTF